MNTDVRVLASEVDRAFYQIQRLHPWWGDIGKTVWRGRKEVFSCIHFSTDLPHLFGMLLYSLPSLRPPHLDRFPQCDNQVLTKPPLFNLNTQCSFPGPVGSFQQT